MDIDMMNVPPYYISIDSIFVLQLWSLEQEEVKEEVKVENEPLERKVNYKTVVVTEVTDSGNFYAQNVESGECNSSCDIC